MASTSVTFDILAKDRASAKFDHLGHSIDGSSTKMSKFTGVMKSAGKVAAVGLVAGLAGAAYAGVKFGKAAAEDQQQAALLAGQLKRSAGATDEQVAATERWISAQGVSKGVADDDLRPALARLATATGDVGKAQDLASLAMDVSAGTGKSLASVSTALMKAQNGQVSSLSRLGIQTKNAAGETLSMKDAVAEMSHQFGGAATQKANTLQGKMDRLKLVMRETGEAIGYKLLPIASTLAGFFLNKLIPVVSDAVDYFGKIAKIGWGKLKEAGGAIKDFFSNGKGHAALAASIDIIKDAAGKIHTGFEKAADAVGRIKTAIGKIDFSNLDSKKIGELIGTAISVGLDKIVELAPKATKAIKDMFAKVDWVDLGVSMGLQVPALLTGLAIGILNFDPMPILKGLADHWQMVVIAVLSVAFAPAKIAGGLGKILAKIPFVGKFLEIAVRWLNELGGKVLHFGEDLFKSFWKGFTGGKGLPGAGLVTKILNALKGIPGKVGDFFVTLGVRIGVWAIDAFEHMGSGIRTALVGALKFVASIPGKIISGIGNLARLLFPKGMAVVDSLWDGLKNRVGVVFDWVKALPGRIVSAIGNLGSLLYGAGSALLQGLYDGIVSKWQKVQSLVSSMGGWIKDHKGPITKDRVLLKPAGQAIMDGLIDGLESRRGALKTFLLSVGAMIGSTFAAALADMVSAGQSAIGSARDAMNQFADFSNFGGNLFSADITSGGPDGTGPTGLAAIQAYAAQQKAQSQQLATDVTKLVGMGLSQDLIEQLKSQGASGLAQIHALAGASPQEIAAINADMAAAAAAQQQAGNSAATQMREDLSTMAAGVTELNAAWKRYADAPVPLTVTMHVDGFTGKPIVQSIKAYKRENGNVPLGIA